MSPLIDGQQNEDMCVDVKPCCFSLCDTGKQKESSGETPDDSWRRGELNEGPPLRNHLTSQQLTNSDSSPSAHCQQIASTARHVLAPSDAVFRRITDVWPGLPGEIRTLVEALCLQPPSCGSPSKKRTPGNAELGEIVASWAVLPVTAKNALLSVVRSCLEVSRPPEDRRE